MISTTPAADDLCIAPELAILAAPEVSRVVAAQVLNVAHIEILAPGDERHPTSPDTKTAAEIIAQATRPDRLHQPPSPGARRPRRLPK
jgi:hypothetical protein